MERIFIDNFGRYYKAEDPKDPGDAEFTHPTPEMFQFLTEVPISRVDFEGILLKKRHLISY